MTGCIVQWTEGISEHQYAVMLDAYPEEFQPEHFDREYAGEVIAVNRSWFWGTTYLTVSCTDGRVRTVNADKVTILKQYNRCQGTELIGTTK